VQPPPGGADCSTADFSTAATAGTASRAVPGDTRSAVTKLTVPSPSRVGCYQLTGHVDVSLPGGPTVRVPIADPDAPRVLVVHPVVTYAMNRIWSYQRGQVSADVTVIGTFGQPVHVALRMMHIPDANLQCRNADYAAARPTNTGPAVAARANLATVRVRSGPLTAAGCYRPVPVLTMDANRSITATGSFDALLSAVAVGPDPNAAPPIASGPAPPADRPWLAEICTAAAFVLLCLCAFGYAVASARRTARLLPEHDDQLLLR
jgi:hypothetical protein